MSGNGRVFVPGDSTARSLGGDAVADAVRAQAPGLDIIRTGSRGLYWLEPLVEIETAAGRIGFGPVAPGEIKQLFAKGQAPEAKHPACLGLVEELPELKAQQRLTCARAGLIDPLSLEDYKAHGGFAGLEKARAMAPADIVAEVTASGLRGRGGAAFPTGIKWRTVLEAPVKPSPSPTPAPAEPQAPTGQPKPAAQPASPAGRKYIVCNADEGDSGTFVDRIIMESDPFCLIEGMLIAGLATGADAGFIYCRAEYPQAIRTLEQAIASAASAGYLDGFRLQVRKAAGAYICGEETSLLESLEGKRGMVRYRPPLPAVEGLFGQPTVVNNVVSLATAPIILAHGAEHYRSFGAGKSAGTLTVQLAGNIRRGGLYELPFGTPLRAVLEELGGGTISGKPIKAVQAGGPLGTYIPPAQFDTPLDYEAFKGIGAMLGHGGLVVFDEAADLGALARFAMHFCAEESCGKCTPCRIGAVRGREVIDKIRRGEAAADNRILLKDLCQTMIDGSLCGLGGMAPLPVLSVLEHFGDEL